MDIQHRERRQTVVTFGEDDSDIIAACAYSTQRFRVDRASIQRSSWRGVIVYASGRYLRKDGTVGKALTSQRTLVDLDKSPELVGIISKHLPAEEFTEWKAALR